MTSDQQATFQTVQEGIRSGLKLLALPCMSDVTVVSGVQEHLQSARDAVDALLLESGTPIAQRETQDQIFSDWVGQLMAVRAAMGKPISEDRAQEKIRQIIGGENE